MNDRDYSRLHEVNRTLQSVNTPRLPGNRTYAQSLDRVFGFGNWYIDLAGPDAEVGDIRVMPQGDDHLLEMVLRLGKVTSETLALE